MDEPFAALDELTRESMRQLVGRLIRGRDVTVVLVTHSVAEAVALGDRVVVASPRPMRVVADVAVDLAHPRAAGIDDDPTFVATCALVRHALAGGDEAAT
jgi:NitT/TauT family transport system ATP-binding protein